MGKKELIANNIENGIEYTIVLDRQQLSPDPQKDKKDRERDSGKGTDLSKDKERITASNTENGIEYTIVLDKQQLSPDALTQKSVPHNTLKENIDLLYEKYEKMCLNEPNVADREYIYPRTYHWRISSRYDKGKAEALIEALRKRIRIEDTEAYSRYIENISQRFFAPDSWE